MKSGLFALMTLAAGPALAWEPCDELWFTRNLIHDRAGYCFSSDLGRALFDNLGCTPGPVTLTGQAARNVATIQGFEADLACDVDTTRRSLDILNTPMRMQMVDIPIPMIAESRCQGWRGAPLTLHVARDDRSAVSGVIATGSDVIWTFLPVDGWQFLQEEWSGQDMGWVRVTVTDPEQCFSAPG